MSNAGKGLVFGSINIDYVYQMDHYVRPVDIITGILVVSLR